MAEFFDTFLQTHFPQAKKVGSNKWMALCPAHDDKNPSLSISEGRDGQVLFTCHANCTLAEIVGAMSLKVSDLFPPKPSGYDGRARSLIASYDYTDELGTVLFRVNRYHPKSFSQCKPNGKDGWERNVKGVRKVLYKLPKVLKAAKHGDMVFIVEGEKDVTAIETLGLTGTCNAGGAGKWLKSYSKSLEGSQAIILPDNDKPGRAHAEKVAQSLDGLAASIRVVELPNLPQGGDLSDWLKAGGTADELLRLVDAVGEWIPATTDESEGSKDYPYTDLGNVERLAAAHGKDLRFNTDSGQWLFWTGSVWAEDWSGLVDRLARRTIRGLYSLLRDCETRGLAERLFSHIEKSESRPRLEAIVSMARKHEGMPVRSEHLDSDPWLLNCLNGTLDLRTGELREHRREDLCTKIVPVNYDHRAECPRWEQFLKEVFSDDEELINFVQRAIGYTLTGDTSEQCFFLCTGKGSNGKSRFLEIIRAMLGGYAEDTPVTTFLDKRDNSSSSTCDLASLVGCRFVGASEGEDTTSFNEPLLKSLTGQDSIRCRHLYKGFFTYRPDYKIWFRTNEVPRFRTSNYAMRRRVKLIPFHVRFYYPHEQKYPVRDEGLEAKLIVELPGILAWAVRGCLAWQKEGLGMPQIMREEVDSLFEDMDPIIDFVERECVLHPGVQVESGVLWKRYLEWCEENKRKPAFKQTCHFTRCLTSRDGIESQRTNESRFLRGIGLLSGQHEDSKVTPSDAKRDSSVKLPMKEELKEVSETSPIPSLGVTNKVESDNDNTTESAEKVSAEPSDDGYSPKDLEIDTKHQAALFDYGKKHGYPELSYDVDVIGAGEGSWVQFINTPGPEGKENRRLAIVEILKRDY